VFLPTYSSWLNWIEAEFAALRYFALNGTDHRSHTEQDTGDRRLPSRPESPPFTAGRMSSHHRADQLPRNPSPPATVGPARPLPRSTTSPIRRLSTGSALCGADRGPARHGDSEDAIR
jgi:hypothetical protein